VYLPNVTVDFAMLGLISIASEGFLIVRRVSVSVSPTTLGKLVGGHCTAFLVKSGAGVPFA
jgi:hypothetical protein